MLNVGIVGIGKAGNMANLVATLANQRLDDDELSINSSETDLTSVSNSMPKKLIRSKNENNRVLIEIP